MYFFQMQNNSSPNLLVPGAKSEENSLDLGHNVAQMNSQQPTASALLKNSLLPMPPVEVQINSFQTRQDDPPAGPQDKALPHVPRENALPAVPRENALLAMPRENVLPAVHRENALPAVPRENALPAVHRENALPAAPHENVLPAVPEDKGFPAVPRENALPVVHQENALPAVPRENALPAVPQENALPALPLVKPLPVVPPENDVPFKSGKIVGGDTVERGQFPFMVSLMRNTGHYGRYSTLYSTTRYSTWVQCPTPLHGTGGTVLYSTLWYSRYSTLLHFMEQ